MSEKSLTKACGGKFGVVPAHALETPGLSSGAIRLYAILCRHADKGDGTCYRANQTLAVQAGTTPRTIQRWRRALEEAGLVKVVGRYRNANLYTVVRDPKARLDARTKWTEKAFKNRERFAEYGRKGAPRRAEVRAQKVAGEKLSQPVKGDKNDTPGVTELTPLGVTNLTPKEDPMKKTNEEDSNSNEGNSDMETGTAAADALARSPAGGSRSGRSDQDRRQPGLLMPIPGGMTTATSCRASDPVVFPAPRSNDSFEEDGFRDSPPCQQSDPAEPKAPDAHQRTGGGFRPANAEKGQRRQRALDRWIKDLMTEWDGEEILAAVMNDMRSGIEHKATDAEERKHGTGLPIILDWHRREAAAA